MMDRAHELNYPKPGIPSSWVHCCSCLWSVFSINLLLLTTDDGQSPWIKLSKTWYTIIRIMQFFKTFAWSFCYYVTVLSFEHILYFLLIFDNVMSNGKMTEEWWMEKYMERCSCGLIEANPSICLDRLRQPLEKTSVRLAGVWASIWSRHLPASKF